MKKEKEKKGEVEIVFFFIFYLFIYFISFSFSFGCVGSSLQHAGFSLVVACGFSLSSCLMQAPERVGSVVCGTQAQ